MSLNLEHPQQAKSKLTRIEELEDKIIELTSKLDAQEQDISNLYAKFDSLEYTVENSRDTNEN